MNGCSLSVSDDDDRAVSRTGTSPSQRYVVKRVDAGVSAVDLELDAPDDVVNVVARPSAVTVDLQSYDPATVSDASLDRVAAARSMVYPSPVQTQSHVNVATSCTLLQPTCDDAPCYPSQCAVTMTDVPCDPSPVARCSQSLERVGVVCRPEQCDDVCPATEPPPPPPSVCSAPTSMINQMCQTELPYTSSTSRGSRSAAGSQLRSSTSATTYETETDFDRLYSDHADDVCQVS